MTAWEMVEYFGRLYGMEDAELRERMEQLFDRLRIQPSTFGPTMSRALA